MPSLTAVGLVTAGLLALAGGQKLLDPTMTVGALRALGAPGTDTLVRAGALAELLLGVGALAWGGAGMWWLVAASYLAFAGFVLLALRAGTMIGSCGCFGREETPPHWTHIVLNLVLALGAASVAVVSPEAPLDAVARHPGNGAVVIGLAILALYLLQAAFVELPRTMLAGRSGSRGVES